MARRRLKITNEVKYIREKLSAILGYKPRYTNGGENVIAMKWYGIDFEDIKVLELSLPGVFQIIIKPFSRTLTIHYSPNDYVYTNSGD
jgi:hypothetical protein